MQAPPLPGRLSMAPSWMPAFAPARLGALRQRLRERQFWTIHAGVALITAGHWLTEALMDGHEHGTLLGVAVHLPVILYLVPVAYAALRYGLEGGLLTGAWAAILAVPNMVIYHRHGLEWVGELALILMIIALGAVVALPVERERLQRTRAEQAHVRATMTSQRLALLNEIISLLARNQDLESTLRRVLRLLAQGLELRAAAVTTRSSTDAHPAVEVCVADGQEAHLPRRMLRLLPPLDGLPDGLVQLDSDVAAIAFDTGAGGNGAVVVAGRHVRSLSRRDRDLLAVVAAQLGAAFETARLHREERQRWRVYLQQATRAQEEERRRIARELHDVVTHELLLVDRELDQLTGQPPEAGPPAEALQDVRNRITGVVAHLRRFSSALRPSVLTHLGLPAALEWLADEVRPRASLAIHVEIVGETRRLPEGEELALFRIAEEALRNADHHGRAATVVVTLAFHSDDIHLEITDDGLGFDMPSALEDLAQHDKLGLLGMRERAELIGASLQIDTTPAHGTRIRVRLPDDRTGQASHPSADDPCPAVSRPVPSHPRR